MHAFENCTSLKHINIPKNLIDLKDYSFTCSGIETIEFENGIEKIGKAAFAYTDIKTVILPKSVLEISEQAFSFCTELESLTLNQGLSTIGNEAFGYTQNLTEIVIPASVTKISERAFSGCNTLQAVKFEGNAPEGYRYENPKYIHNASYTIYYHKQATGFTSPEWCGYPTALW
jgi:hypothetical protein